MTDDRLEFVWRDGTTHNTPPPDDEKLSAERAVRLLRAKAAQMETWVKPRLGGPGTTDLDWLVADVALIADLLADHIEMNRQTPIDWGAAPEDVDPNEDGIGYA